MPSTIGTRLSFTNPRDITWRDGKLEDNEERERERERGREGGREGEGEGEREGGR